MKKQVITAMLVMAIGSGAALAQPGKTAPRGPQYPGWFDLLDRDGDGVVTKAELEQLQSERFQRMDTDGDGVLSAEELYQGLQRERAERMHRRLDRDGDGRVSLEEFSAMPLQHFSRLDRDGDGQVSKEDLRRKGPGKDKAKRRDSSQR